MSVIACVTCLSATSALAAETGFYFGAFGGRSDYEFAGPQALTAVPDLTHFIPDQTSPIPIFDNFPPGFFTAGELVVSEPTSWRPLDDSKHATAWGVTAGYRIVRYAAVELSYLDLGEIEQRTPVIGFPSQPRYEIHEQLRTSGPTLSALGTLPIVRGWSVYARAGVLFAEMAVESSEANNSNDTAYSSRNLLWGAGTQLDWGDHWSVRLDFQRFENIGDDFEPVEADVDLLNLGVLYRL